MKIHTHTHETKPPSPNIQHPTFIVLFPVPAPLLPKGPFPARVTIYIVVMSPPRAPPSRCWNPPDRQRRCARVSIGPVLFRPGVENGDAENVGRCGRADTETYTYPDAVRHAPFLLQGELLPRLITVVPLILPLRSSPISSLSSQSGNPHVGLPLPSPLPPSPFLSVEHTSSYRLPNLPPTPSTRARNALTISRIWRTLSNSISSSSIWRRISLKRAISASAPAMVLAALRDWDVVERVVWAESYWERGRKKN